MTDDSMILKIMLMMLLLMMMMMLLMAALTLQKGQPYLAERVVYSLFFCSMVEFIVMLTWQGMMMLVMMMILVMTMTIFAFGFFWCG